MLTKKNIKENNVTFKKIIKKILFNKKKTNCFSTSRFY